MAYIITSQCISCNRCQSICPTNAIRVEGQHRWIDSTLCNNCIGYYGVPQCAAACPTNRGCVPSLGNTGVSTTNGDYWEAWFNLHDRLVARLIRSKQTRYWEQWFNTYSQKLSKQIQSHKLQSVRVPS